MTTVEKSIQIEKDQPAPFAGFLIPEYQFRKTSEDLTELDFLRAEANAPHFKDESWGVLPFTTGAVLGALTVLVMTRK